MSSSSSLSDEERARAEAFADAEVERINPRCRSAYRHVVLQRVTAEIIDDRNRQLAFQALIVGQADDVVRHSAAEIDAYEEAIERWESDPAARRAVRERALLLAKLESEQGVDASW